MWELLNASNHCKSTIHCLLPCSGAGPCKHTSFAGSHSVQLSQDRGRPEEGWVSPLGPATPLQEEPEAPLLDAVSGSSHHAPFQGQPGSAQTGIGRHLLWLVLLPPSRAVPRPQKTATQTVVGTAPREACVLVYGVGNLLDPFPSIVHYSKSPTQPGVPCQERVRKSNRRKWQPTAVFLPGMFMDRGAWWPTVYGVTKSQRHACTPN